MDASPLSHDELAAAYLKSRDIPCPHCAYNRRDGMSAACPECGHDLAIIHEGGRWNERYRILAKRYFILLTVINGTTTVIWGISVYFLLSYAISNIPVPNVYAYLIYSTVGVIAYLIILTLCIRGMRSLRFGGSQSPTRTAMPMLIYVIVTIALTITNYIISMF